MTEETFEEWKAIESICQRIEQLSSVEYLYDNQKQLFARQVTRILNKKPERSIPDNFDISTIKSPAYTQKEREEFLASIEKTETALKLQSLAEQIRVDRISLPQIASLNALLLRYEVAFPDTELSEQFQLSVLDDTSTKYDSGNYLVSGSIEVSYVIPANISHATARSNINTACAAREDRPLEAINDLIFSWSPRQETERSDNSSVARKIKYTIDFDYSNEKVNIPSMRDYAKEKKALITPVELQILGAALYYEKTGLDLLKGYWSCAISSYNENSPLIAVAMGTDVAVTTMRDPNEDYSNLFYIVSLSEDLSSDPVD